jgi:midasin (ATPase involved in ribosome maturation)
MATMQDKINRFVTLAFNAGYTSPLSRSQIKALKAKHNIPMPAWLMKDDSHRAGHGKYHCPELTAMIKSNGGSVAAPAAVAPVVAAPAPVAAVAPATTTLSSRVVPTAANTVSGASLIPDKDSLYVPYGHFKDIETIIGSGRFYPIYITGLSGNGKTTMVEQVCARLKRECLRVNIIATTDEDDLLGGFRLVNGETVWQDGPVTLAMKRGAVLLLDEVDLGTDKMMCLQPVLEGKGVYLKKINEKVVPAAGFTVVATANTKGQGGENSERFAGTRIQNEAFLERFKITLEQEYPSRAQERKIVLNLMDNFNCRDEDFADNLTKWSEIIRKTFNEGAIDDMITTRRLCAIVDNYSIFGDKMKAIKQTIARFTADSQEAFLNLFTKVSGEEEKSDSTTTATSGAVDPMTVAARINLSVPFGSRLEVKTKGAMWDPNSKCWHITGQMYSTDSNYWKTWNPVIA